MVSHPWAQFEVDLFEQDHIALVVLLHEPPGGGIAVKAPLPKREAAMRHLGAQAKPHAQVAQFVAAELEVLFRYPQGVNLLVWRRRGEAVKDELGVANLVVE